MEEMTMKEKCLEALKNMGFQTEYHEGLGYGFKYEGRHYLFMPNENDDTFLSISLPGVVEMGDIPEDAFYKLMDKMNATLKYVKTNTLHDDMWLFYEREIICEEDIEAVVRRMILRLDAALVMLRHEMKESEESEENDEEDENEEDGENNDENNDENAEDNVFTEISDEQTNE